MKQSSIFLVVAACLSAFGQQAVPNASVDAYLNRVFNTEEFKLKSFGPAAWLDEGAAYTTVENKEIIRYDTASGQREVLVSAAALTPKGRKDPLMVSGYKWSPDKKLLLIFTNTKKVWRQNTRGDYWLLDRASGSLKQLGGAGVPESVLMFAKFSPDSRKVAYVKDNNIYSEDLQSGNIRQLTTDGSSKLVNGTSDWVYEEELDLRDGFRWNPDSRSIAYWQFDTTGVGIFNLIDNTSSTYPKLIPIPYPKVGTTNSAVRIGVVPVEGGKTKWMELPGDTRENYAARMEWDNSGRLIIQQLNRLQNTNDVLLADARSGNTKRIFRDEDKAWVDVNQPHATGSGAFVWLSERDGWRRAYHVSKDGTSLRPLTPTGLDVMQISSVTKEWLYYIASPANATERHLFRVPLTEGATQAPEQLSRTPGTHGYNISPSGAFAFHTFSTFDSPPRTELIRLPEHLSIRALAENSIQLQNPPVEFFQVNAGSGVSMDAWMIKPANFDPSKKYPVLVHVYGEPAGVTVTNAWQGTRGLFHRAVANLGYLVVSMDNRGTPAPKGRAWRKVVYGSVGVHSSQDQAAGLRALIASRPYVDGGRVAVWGWSGGGSNTLNLMFRSPDLYHVGMSVAPVPDQTLYDTIYQERYMGVPKDNAAGYKDGSPITFAEGLRGKLLVVHGTGDDNVHYQGLEKLMNRLIELGKPFDMMSYPNRSHSISEGKGTSFHLHSLLARYLQQNLPAGGR
jgi:dipeptidyl-peptidase 4